MNRLRRNRWLLTPVLSWRARSLAKKTGIDQDVAWLEIRKITHPEEELFWRRRHPDL